MAAMVIEWLRLVARRRFFRFGVPFLICIVGGSFALKQFTSVRYDFTKRKMITNEEAEKYGIKMKKSDQKQSVESVYEDINKEDVDNWNNIRGPRPWEDSRSVQDLQRQKSTAPI